jgi:ribosomal protein S18 acetylase RimI-like enzyme
MSKDTIRRAHSADAEALVQLSRDTFRAAFGDLYWPHDLEAYLAGAYGLEKTRGDLSDPRIGVWLAERDGVAIGYAQAGPCDLPHADVTATCAELKRIYLAPDAQGAGLGSRLMSQALGWLERDGPRRIWIGVWSGNRRARRLYEHLGFAKVGEYYFKVGEAMDREFILRRG